MWEIFSFNSKNLFYVKIELKIWKLEESRNLKNESKILTIRKFSRSSENGCETKAHKSIIIITDISEVIIRRRKKTS